MPIKPTPADAILRLRLPVADLVSMVPMGVAAAPRTLLCSPGALTCSVRLRKTGEGAEPSSRACWLARSSSEIAVRPILVRVGGNGCIHRRRHRHHCLVGCWRRRLD